MSVIVSLNLRLLRPVEQSRHFNPNFLYLDLIFIFSWHETPFDILYNLIIFFDFGLPSLTRR